MPPRSSISEILKDTSTIRIADRQVSVNDYKKTISPLLSVIPQLERGLPPSGNVFVGKSIYQKAVQGAQLVCGLQNIKQLDKKIFEYIVNDRIEEELDGIYIDENGNIHHHGTGSSSTDPSTTTPSTPEEEAVDPVIEARRNQGRQFCKQLIGLPWVTYSIPMTNMIVSSINLDHSKTEQFKTILNDNDMQTGFLDEIWVEYGEPFYDNALRWRKVIYNLGIGSLTSSINNAITFGPFTGLTSTEINGVPYLGKRTDTNKVFQRLDQLSQGISNGDQPTNSEKEVTASNAIDALLNADWDHGWLYTKVNLSHEQAQTFGKGCKLLGPWLIEQGRRMQQTSSDSASNDNSDSASKIVGTILVVFGNILQYFGQAILNLDKGNGIVLHTNFWIGLLVGTPIIYPTSR